jgi:hypothetical protein
MNPDYDQGGHNTEYTMAYLGPSLGNALLPVAAQTDVTSTSPYQVEPFDNRIMLKAACTSVLLPPVAAWVQAQTPAGYNWSGFTRELWVKDLGGHASSGAPIVITPSGSETIDGLPQYSIVTPKQLLRIYPIRGTLEGWWIG